MYHHTDLFRLILYVSLLVSWRIDLGFICLHVSRLFSTPNHQKHEMFVFL